MGIADIDITRRGPYEDGVGYGQVGPYERIDGVAHYAIDPTSPLNWNIVDIDSAARGDDGLVHFEGDITIVRPVDPARSKRVALVEVPNRGRRTAPSLFNRAPPVLEPTEHIHPGDGFLFANGWTVAWCGWQWDVPRSPARMGLTVPVLVDGMGNPIEGEVQLRIQLGERVACVALTDHHVGSLGGHDPLPAADLDDPSARLLVRDGIWGEPEEIPRSQWRFARQAEDIVVPDNTHLWLEKGFEPGRIYDLIYLSQPCRLAGAGLVAVRDFGSFLHSDRADNPCAGQLDQVHVTGQSQCGRFLRTFFHLGLNRTEDQTMAYDGALIHIAGGRRGEFNHRGAQPSVQPTPSFGHLFPFADQSQTDPRTGRRDGLIERAGHDLGLPLVIYTNTSSEYWRGDASLAHTSVVDGSDVEPPSNTRHYLFASTQHGPGLLPLMDESLYGARGGNWFNIIDYSPLMRAALSNLHAWAADGVEPPANAIPSSRDGTATTRQAALAAMATLVATALPSDEGLPVIYPLDLGPEAATGVGRYPAVRVGDPYPCLVSALDDDGNELAGIRLPEIMVPLATNTGWNPRHPQAGAQDEILEYLGSTVPFAVDEAHRADTDHRAPLATRYPNEADYLARIRTAAEELVAARYLLAIDIDTCEETAAARYRAVTNTVSTMSTSGMG